MAVDSATWYLSSTDENPLFNASIVLRIEGDTLLNNMLYAKIYHYDIIQDKISVKTRKLLGLIRDDISNKKVYGGLLGGVQYGFQLFLNSDAQCDWGDTSTFNEHLLYDFDVQVGDTLTSCMLSHPTVVSTIDTIVLYGYQRRNLNLKDDHSSMMTEGIGTCMGIFQSDPCFFTGGGILYALTNYCIGSFSECNFLTSSEVELPMRQMDIYPNPTNGLVTIELDNIHINDLIEVYDLFGRKRLSKTIETGMEHLDISTFEEGMYIITIKSTALRMQYERLIKIN